MIVPIPCIQNARNKKKKLSMQKTKEEEMEQPLLVNDNQGPHDESQEPMKKSKKANHEEEEHLEPFGELLIHQFIEAIEFILGGISNTASYLRLWALSLAHSQLTETFYYLMMAQMAFTKQDSDTKQLVFSSIAITIGFFVVAFTNVGIILVMDLMECMLHCMRLHWVEFQGKFYKGDGMLFAAYKCEKEVESSY